MENKLKVNVLRMMRGNHLINAIPLMLSTYINDSNSDILIFIFYMEMKDGRFIFGGDRIPHPAHRPGLLHPLPRLPQNSDSISINRKHASEVLPILENLKVLHIMHFMNLFFEIIK